MPEVRPVVEPSSTKVSLRPDLTPPQAIDTIELALEPWLFVEVPRGLLWRGEGPRCEATYPPNRPEGSVRCELVDGHMPDWSHYAQRSSV